MKRGGLHSWGFMAVLLMLAAFVFADGVAQNFESKIIETFDADSTRKWEVQGSKFSAPEYPEKKMVKTWPEALFRDPKADTSKYQALGIRGRFTRKGYNYIELIPVKDDGNGGVTADPIPLPGRVRNFDLWAWGGNLSYYVEIHLEDHFGITHVLKLGDLNFIGWKKLQVTIPNTISQSVQYAPSYRPIKLTKIVIWSKPEEKRTDDFYIYFDHMMVFTDMFESPFDGDYLTRPEIIQEIWSKSGK